MSKMNDFIKLIPEQYRKWYIFLILSILLGQLVRGLSSKILGNNDVPVVPSLQSSYEMGQITASAIVWGVGGLIIYWWYIYRGKMK